MRYLQGVPEDFLKKTFAYDPASPSGIVRLRRYPEKGARSSHICKPKEGTYLLAQIKINGKNYRRRLPFGWNGKLQSEARLEAEVWISTIKIDNPEKPSLTGTKDSNGCWLVNISFKGKMIQVRAHRLIYFLCTDIDIEGMDVCHIDTNTSKNKIENLRATKKQERSQNTRRLTRRI